MWISDSIAMLRYIKSLFFDMINSNVFPTFKPTRMYTDLCCLFSVPRGHSDADGEMEQEVRLAQLEKQHQELGAELAIRVSTIPASLPCSITWTSKTSMSVLIWGAKHIGFMLYISGCCRAFHHRT